MIFMIFKIKKRNGKIVDFKKTKITNAIHKAMRAVDKGNVILAEKLSSQVVKILNKKFAKRIPTVENVQDIVEEVLIKNKLAEVAKAYILYRQKRTEIRVAKKFMGVEDELKFLTLNAIRVLQKRYLLKDISGKVIETPGQMFRRVAKAIAKADKKYGQNVKKTEGEFYNAMVNLDFLPNSPTLMNAGTELGQLSACFVIPIEDSLKSIMKAATDMVLIQQSGGGTGFSFSKIRPKGDIVKSTKGVASGPVSFMRIFDTCTDVMKQGGKRRGANMGILHITHPDIVEFITAKGDGNSFSNFNLSVAVTDKFMQAVKKNNNISLINPRTKKVVAKVPAKSLFDMIVLYAWKKGDPGMIFIDEINRKNPTPEVGEIESTNPCGEQPLLPYESCNLGSINLANMVKDGKIDWKKLRKTIQIAVHFLDNVIDVNKYPVKEVEKITKANRKIGLGVMGFAEMLIQIGVKYDSNEGLKVAESVMKFIEKESHKASIELAKIRGVFPNYKKSIWARKKQRLRNATVTTIAPTGTISIIAGCSSGIEPLFAISFLRNVMGGTKLIETNKYFEKIAKERGFYSDELMNRIAKVGSIQNIKGIPKDVKRIFVTALDIKPKWHVKMQAIFQKYTDNAVSKTINIPHDATIEDVRKAYLLAHKLKCKGITVYRYGSKKEQVLYIGPAEKLEKEEFISAGAEYAGGCPSPLCPH